VKRRTYTERRPYSARVMRFREAVYRPRAPIDMYDLERDEPVTFTVTNGCRLLLLRLSDDMNANAITQVSRTALAQHLGVAPARVTEWVRVAHRFGLLDTVRRGQPGITAVYQGLVPPPGLVLPGVPSTRYARADQAVVLPGVPPSPPAWYALGTTPEGTRPADSGTVSESPRARRSSGEETEDQPTVVKLPVCQWHGHARCPEDCANHPDNREATA
jgi:hypothetical protein